MNGSSLLPDQRGRLHRAQAHIESALDEPLRLRSLARQAAFSPFHFHRLFARLTGEGVHAHVQRLRLERAAFELVHSTTTTILTIALNSGYHSPAAFSRAFRRSFGRSPREFRQERAILARCAKLPPGLRREFARLTPEWRLEPALRLRCIRRRGEAMLAAGDAWETIDGLLASNDSAGKNRDRFELTPDFPEITPSMRMRFDVGVADDTCRMASDELIERVVPAGRYAVFRLPAGREAKAAINQLWSYLYFEWAPAAGVRLRASGSYEAYRHRGHAHGEVELHVPV